MRGFFTFILFFLFFLSFPLAIFSYAINSILSPGYIKEKLAESKIYTNAAASIPSLIKSSEDVEAQMTDQAETDFKEFLKKEVTAEYLQKKTESLVDATFDWLSGKTEATPTLNLSDLNGKLATFAKEKGSPLPEDFIEPAPLKFEPTKDNLKIRQIFQIIQKVPIFLAAASGVILLLIFLLAKSWKSKLRKLSLAFFVPVILGVGPAAALVFLGQVAIGLITDRLKQSQMEQLSESVKNLLSAVTSDLIRALLTILGLLLLAAAVLFVVSFFVGNKPKEAPEALQSGIK
jgi:hypothetical protein